MAQIVECLPSKSKALSLNPYNSSEREFYACKYYIYRHIYVP
jgi:hypothetical protein